MDRRASLALASAILAISAFVISLKIIQPESLSVYVGSGGNSTLVTKIPGLYSFDDILEVFFPALVAGFSAAYLLIPRRNAKSLVLGDFLLNQKRNQWQEISKTLKEDEVKIYQAILDAGGLMNQGEIGDKVGLSKTTVSRTLDLLESRGLVEKRRRGMSNVILLK
ncbi:MAG: DUF7343 domain-containing protein [Nitrososphaerales archaeon]